MALACHPMDVPTVEIEKERLHSLDVIRELLPWREKLATALSNCGR